MSKKEPQCTCELQPKGNPEWSDDARITFELALVKCPLCAAAPDLLAVAHACWHLCAALTASREGVGQDLIDEIRNAAHAALSKAKEKVR